jgi:pyruvate-ferredoxin/flavodoxin oxidoreductase
LKAVLLDFDHTLAHLHAVQVPASATSTRPQPDAVAAAAPAFVKNVTGPMLAGKGDRLPVSAFAADGTWPVGTTQWEKRNLAADIPVWDERSASSATSARSSVRTRQSASG